MRYLTLALILFWCSCALAIQVVDDLGQPIETDHPPLRIISLAPDITEILFAIGLGERVVGVIEGSDYPQAARRLPIVGSYSGLDLEKIIVLSPDLIITWRDYFTRELAPLRARSVPIYKTAPKRLNDVARTMRSIGLLTGQIAKADHAAQAYEVALEKLQMRYQQSQRIKVFYQIGDYGFLTINRNSWINQVIGLCGGKNIFADAQTLVPEVELEAIIRQDPDVIVNGSANTNWQASWRERPYLTAVKNNQLISLPPDWINRAGPRLIKGAEFLCEKLDKIRRAKKYNS